MWSNNKGCDFICSISFQNTKEIENERQSSPLALSRIEMVGKGDSEGQCCE